MILIDSLYINNSGGKILLDYLMSELKNNLIEVTYLLDERVRWNTVDVGANQKVIFLKASLKNRKRFYKKERNSFSKVLCFANLPPNIKINAQVYTYFHQLLFLKLPSEMSFSSKIVYNLKMIVLNNLKSNTNYWIVQTDLVKNRLSQKYNIDKKKILTLPFYPQFESSKLQERVKNQYLYVSHAPPHKNHIRLINAFCGFYDEHKKGQLILTVSEEFGELVKIIKGKQALGYPIQNLGLVDRQKLQNLYSQSEFQIFPSLTESFGLGIIEAIENGCKIIGADLDYTYIVCEPSLVFNPFEESSIIKALSLSTSENVKPSVAKVQNNINEILELLK